MLSLSSALLQICFLLMRAHSTAAAARSLAGSMAGEATRSGDAAHQDSLSPAGVAAPRLLACSLMKNEVPYALEWIEFHRLMGFDRIVIYDDFSTDNASMLSSLYEQHGRNYLTIEPGLEDEDPRIRRIRSAADCFTKYKDQSDWLIHLDIDEFVWSPAHPDLPTYFMQEVPDKTHIIYAGATRFGFNGQKSRHSFALHEVDAVIKLTNPHGIQLLTESHVMRAADRRFGEPEDIILASLDGCKGLDAAQCTNDNNGIHGKTFLRSSLAHGLWTHGGSVKSDKFGSHRADAWGFRVVSLGNGGSMHTDDCPAPICQPSGIDKLHIYHMRSPSIEDAAKKNADWHWTNDPAADAAISVQRYEQETAFYNQIRDVALVRFAPALRERIQPLLS